MRYVTTNIRIEEDILKELKYKAIEEGKRMAELIREAIKSYLGKIENTKTKNINKKDTVFKIIGMCKTGIKDDSEKLDEFLYKE